MSVQGIKLMYQKAHFFKGQTLETAIQKYQGLEDTGLYSVSQAGAYRKVMHMLKYSLSNDLSASLNRAQGLRGSGKVLPWTLLSYP